MKRRLALRGLILASAVSFFHGLPALGSQADFTIRSDVRLVLLDVGVKDHQGGFVSGLAKSNFKVFENGRPQEITVFAHEDLPVTAGILVDESFSMTPKRPDVLAAAQTFIEASNSRDEMFVLNFNDRVKRGLPDGTLFSDNVIQLRSALSRGLPRGKTSLNDAVVEGLKQLELGRRDKKTLVVISDGGDNASEHSRKQMLDMVERIPATIYTIGLFSADDPDRDPGILKQLSKISGGEFYYPQSLADMIPVCRRIARDIRTRYTVGYIPPPQNGASELRHIHVTVSSKDHARLTTQTRTSYRYEDAAISKKR